MPRPLSRRRKAAFAAAALGLLVLVPLAAVEAGGRLLLHARHAVPGKTYGLWQADGELGAVHRAHSWSTYGATNAHGLRGEEVAAPKPEGSLRVLCYGGSSTFCYNLTTEQAWPARLQAALRGRPGGEHDQVLNGGRVAWSASHLARMARRELPVLEPDVVVVYAGVNELLNERYLRAAGHDPEALQAAGRFGVATTDLPPSRWLVRHSLAWKAWLAHGEPRLRGLFEEEAAVVEPDAGVVVAPAGDDAFLASWAWRNYEHALRDLIALAREHGAEPLFVVEAGVGTANAPALRFSAEGARIAREMGVATCDPRPAFAARPHPASLFAASGIHVTAEGADVLAGEIARCLDEMRPGRHA